MDESELGTLSVLNCGSGDLKFRFDKDDSEEVAKAEKVISDMLKRGYTILVEVDGELRRATGFDPTKGCYIVTEPPVTPAAPADGQETPVVGSAPYTRRKGRKREVPADKAKATAFAPVKGGYDG